MKNLTSANTLVLPQKPSGEVPIYWQEEKLGFDKKSRRFDFKCYLALIAEGIGEHNCPIAAEWMSLAVAGGIIAALTGKYMVPPELGRWDWRDNLEGLIWETLWRAFQENPKKLDGDFMAAMLRTFLPFPGAYSRSRQTSDFVEYWHMLRFPDTFMGSIGNVRLKLLREGHKVFALLPKSTKDSIREVKEHLPTMLEIVIKRL